MTSLASSTMYLFAAVATSLTERYGSRIVVIAGSFVSALGLLASSFVTTLSPLYVTYGVIWGLGSSLGLFSSLVILTRYFRRRLTFASGIALAGAASGGLVYGPTIQMLSSKFGISTTFRILAGLQTLMLLCALVFRPVTLVTGTNQRQRKTRFDLSVFKNRAYVIWVVAQCTFMVVFLVPFVHLVSSSLFQVLWIVDCLIVDLTIHAMHACVCPFLPSFFRFWQVINYLIDQLVILIICRAPLKNTLVMWTPCINIIIIN